MAFSFDNSHRRVLPQVIEALSRLEAEPDQLAHEMDHRFNEPPPPYSESGETTQPSTPLPPGPPVVDKWYQRCLREQAGDKSRPYGQFESQAKRERLRLIDQLSSGCRRRQTLPFDSSLDLLANAENNVRSRWVEQGIWGEEWGPPWPKGSNPMDSRHWVFKGKAPFHRATATSHWGHEENEPEP